MELWRKRHKEKKKKRHVAENMFRDVKPTSDITPFTMGGSAETVCVCMDYFCVYAFAYWIRREGGQRGHLYEGLEVSF